MHRFNFLHSLWNEMFCSFCDNGEKESPKLEDSIMKMVSFNAPKTVWKLLFTVLNLI